MIILDTSFLILDFDLNAAEKSSEIMAKLLSSGTAVNALDVQEMGTSRKYQRLPNWKFMFTDVMTKKKYDFIGDIYNDINIR